MKTAKSPVVLVVLLLVPSLAFAQTGTGSVSTSDPETGRVVQFPIEQFNDTLFTNVDTAYRVALDERGDLWYASAGGVVHVDRAARTRELFTKVEGMPSSYATSIALHGGHAYVGTDLGVAIIDVVTGRVETMTRQNSALPDDVVTEIVRDGDDLWIGTHFSGVARYNTTRAEFTAFKNTSTTPGYARPVTRIVPTQDNVWIGTRGDGAWSYDRANGTYTVMLKSDGLVANEVLTIAERGPNVYFGSHLGVQRWAPAFDGTPDEWLLYNRTVGSMPDDYAVDIDVLPTEGGKLDVFVSTRRGIWQLNPETGQTIVRDQTFGILGTSMLDHVYGAQGWAFATTRGVSLKRADDWTYYTSGPSRGVTNAPLSFGATSASVDNDGRHLWFGSSEGVSAYRLSTPERAGKWQNFGPWQNYPGSVVNWIDTERNVTWIGTNQGAYGFDHADGDWHPLLSTNSRNLVYGLAADGDEVWVGLFGDGLIAVNLTTRIERIFTFGSALFPIPDQLVTDVRIAEGKVWVGSSVGVIKIDRLTGRVDATYGKGDGVPGSGVVFRDLPDGPVVWVGTRDGGVGKLDIATGRVTQVWNQTSVPEFPAGEVRALHREGPRLWVGTDTGLARIDLTTGRSTTFTQRNSGLVQSIVNGIVSADGILYVATLSGVSRYDIASETWLPMRDGPGVVRGVPGSTAATAVSAVTVAIDAPRDGVGVAGPTEIRGSAHAFGAAVDRVEVRIGNGSWQPAQGTESWSFLWDPTGLPFDTPVVVAARAHAGAQTSREVQHLLTPVAAPTVPLRVEGVVVTEARAFRPFQLAASATGDEPLEVVASYRAPGAGAYEALPLARQGSLFVGTVPAREMREGTFAYTFRATSGRLEATSPEDATQPYLVTVAPPPRLGVLLEAPSDVTAPAGATTTVALHLTNAGTEPATFGLSVVQGLRTSWVGVPSDEIRLAPSETRQVNATIHVPPNAVAGNVTFVFEARDSAGAADPSTVTVPVQILAVETSATRPTTRDPVPMPGLVLTVALALTLALARRR